ncbi:MAG: hypothetical protein P8K83_02805 [Woeseiaceae bacterium]|nr:hypothetical protein [Woeseiaceae bacterium]
MKKITLRATTISVILNIKCTWPANADTALHSIYGYMYNGLRLFSALVFNNNDQAFAIGDSELPSNYSDATLTQIKSYAAAKPRARWIAKRGWHAAKESGALS